MYSDFEFISIPLKDISLDAKNPRIVLQTKLTSQEQILSYLYEYDGLQEFVQKIANEGKNFGAERPYVVKSGAGYVVVEGNTRIGAYKVLAGLLKAPSGYTAPHIGDKAKAALLNVDCSVAPSRDALLPIMANAHFGEGDKSKWGYLGSRKSLYDEWQSGKPIPKIAKAFERPAGEIKTLILEYLLYLKALSLNWNAREKDALLSPRVEFNPPVRFLQTKGHKDKIGIKYDAANMKVLLDDSEAKKRFKHLLKKLVVNPTPGLGATALYDEVFADYGSKSKAATTSKEPKKGTGSAKASRGSEAGRTGGSTSPRLGSLFNYDATINSGLMRQLMLEAKGIDCRKLPAAATFLLRNIVEAILKEIIGKQHANPDGKLLDLEACLNVCSSTRVTMTSEDKRVLSEFKKHHLGYVNLGAHGNVIPNGDRVAGARDCIDLFVKRNV